MSEVTCESCGREIPEGAPGGDCPHCLLEIGLSTGPGGAEQEAPHELEELQALFSELEVLEFVGRGGMGAVYRAVQRSLDRTVALKILSPPMTTDPSFAERFRREAQALARLNHPNIVTVHESGQKGDLYFLIMEFVDGVDLRQALHAGKLEPAEALAIVPQICDALQYAHDRQVIHRDIKPENILLDRDGRVKIVDFGLAKLLGRGPASVPLTRDRQAMGTVHYVAPEQLRNARDVDNRADIYSLGVVFYEMLTGDIPMGHFAPPSRKVQVDVRLDEVVLRAMEQERERRYSQVSEVKSGVQGLEQPAMTAPVREQEEQDARRIPAAAILGLLGVPIALVAFVAIVGTGARNEYGGLAACAFIVMGLILSAVARNQIRADPQHLRGAKLASVGFWLPLGGLLPALLIMIVVGAFLKADEAWQLEAVRGRAAWQQREAGLRAMVRAAARTYLQSLDGLGSSPSVYSVAPFYDPRSRESLRQLSAKDYMQKGDADELGLALLVRRRLPGGLGQFRIRDVVVIGDSARVTLEHGDRRILFPMRLHEGRWFLALGKLELHGFPPRAKKGEGR